MIYFVLLYLDLSDEEPPHLQLPENAEVERAFESAPSSSTSTATQNTRNETLNRVGMEIWGPDLSESHRSIILVFSNFHHLCSLRIVCKLTILL